MGVRGRENSGESNITMPTCLHFTPVGSWLRTMVLLAMKHGVANLFPACQWELPPYIGKYFRTNFTWKGYYFKPGQSSYCRVPVSVILGKEGEFPRLPVISCEHSALSNHFLVVCQSLKYLTEKKKNPLLCIKFLAKQASVRTHSWAHTRAKMWSHSREEMKEPWFWKEGIKWANSHSQVE